MTMSKRMSVKAGSRWKRWNPGLCLVGMGIAGGGSGTADEATLGRIPSMRRQARRSRRYPLPAPQASLVSGELAGYRGSDVSLQAAGVEQVHNDSAAPYYTVLVDGSVRSTERDRLELVRPGDGAQQSAAANAPPAARPEPAASDDACLDAMQVYAKYLSGAT